MDARARCDTRTVHVRHQVVAEVADLDGWLVEVGLEKLTYFL